MKRIYCPVEGCEWWVDDGGHTSRNIDALKRHVYRAHKLLPYGQFRIHGGVVDQWLSERIAEEVRE